MGNKPSSLDSDEYSVTAIPSHRMRRSPVNTPASRRDWSLINNSTRADRGRILAVEKVDKMFKKNRKAHHTRRYSKRLELVVRRGQVFTMRIICNRRRDEEDGILLAFRLKGDDSPKSRKLTEIILQLFPEDNRTHRHGWTAKLLEDAEGDKKAFMVEVTPSVESIVGGWYLCVDTFLLKKPKKTIRYKENHAIYILFNAWLKDDPVYMSDADKREEYVMEDAGYLYSGVHDKPDGAPWTFDQHEKVVLKCVLELLGKSEDKWKKRSDPIWVSRTLSSLINAQENNGLLFGNWTGNYEGGTAPGKWTGSEDIFAEYYKTKKPVKYAQCWVFAGALATACRALGIPCRPVTCYASGSDFDESRMIEFYQDEKGNKDSLTKDLVWNYHVWVEVWMARKDLNDSQYDGWQVIDGTPSSKSDGLHQKGPCSVVAVKNGDVRLSYDVAFMLSEVNADTVTWLVHGRHKHKRFRVIEVDTTTVGKLVCTKAVGTKDMEELTDSYKHKEGSREEDRQMHKAWLESGIELPHFERQKIIHPFSASDHIPALAFNLKKQEGHLLLGDSISVTLIVEKPTLYNKTHRVEISMLMLVTEYTGDIVGQIKSQEFTAEIEKKETFALEATYWEYEKALGNRCDVRVTVSAYIPDLDYYRPLWKAFRFSHPPVLMSITGTEEKGVEMNVDVQIKNTLPRPLTNGYFKISGPAMRTSLALKMFKGSIPPAEYAEESFKVTPIRRGRIQINAQFYSPEMNYATGYIIIYVK